jgi:hypothetical protein
MFDSKISKTFSFFNRPANVFFKEWKRILLHILVICILVPSIQESIAVDTPHKLIESCNSGIVNGEVSTNDFKGINTCSFQIIQGVDKGVSKQVSGLDKSSVPPKDIAIRGANNGENSSNYTNWDVFYEIVQFIFSIIAAYFIWAMQKPTNLTLSRHLN